MLGFLAILLILGATGVWFARAWRVNVPDPDSRLPFIASWGAGTALGLLAIITKSGLTFGWWAFALGALLLYLMNTGKQSVGSNPIKVGDTLPKFAGIKDDGNDFESEALAGQPVLIKFFRGHW